MSIALAAWETRPLQPASSGIIRREPPWWRRYGQAVMVACARGHVAQVAPPDHTIADDGTVSPSLVCPEPGCDWHETVRLDGWPLPPPPPEPGP